MTTNCLQCDKKFNTYLCRIKKGYRALHEWINRKLGKANHCEINLSHSSKRFVWANISKLYKRDFSDWMQMCSSCNIKDRIGWRVSP